MEESCGEQWKVGWEKGGGEALLFGELADLKLFSAIETSLTNQKYYQKHYS